MINYMVVKETGQAVLGSGLIAYGIGLVQQGLFLEGAIVILVGICLYWWHHRK